MKDKVFEVGLKPFNTKVKVIICSSMEDCVEKANELIPSPNIPYEEVRDSYGCFLEHLHEGTMRYIILLLHDSTINTVVHECFHACMLIADNKGAVWSRESDEFYAYSMGNFTSKVIKKGYQ